jgi:hypothetical protein
LAVWPGNSRPVLLWSLGENPAQGDSLEEARAFKLCACELARVLLQWREGLHWKVSSFQRGALAFPKQIL